MTTAAATAHLTPWALETLVAGALVAVLVTVCLVVVYAVVAGSAAWVLMLALGLLRLGWVTVRGAVRGVRGHLDRAHGRIRDLTPEPDLRMRPSG